MESKEPFVIVTRSNSFDKKKLSTLNFNKKDFFFLFFSNTSNPDEDKKNAMYFNWYRLVRFNRNR